MPLIFEDAQEVRERLVSVEEKVGWLEGFAVRLGGRLESQKRGTSEGVERREITV